MRNKFQIILILSLFCLSCTYYNTFYNAKKSFKEGEKAQKGVSRGVRSTAADQKYEEAIKKASKVLTFHPKSKWADDALFLIGRAYYNMGEYAKAERKFKELLASFPKSNLVKDSHYYVSLCQYRSGNEQDAIGSFKLIIESDKIEKKKKAEAAFLLGEIYFEREEYKDAINYYQYLVENHKKDSLASIAQFRIGESFWQKKDYVQAKEALAKVENYDPKPEKLFESKLKTGECFYLLGDYEEGMDILTKLAEENKDSLKLPLVKLKIAEGILLSDKIEEAIQEYDEIIKDYPKTEHSATALFQLGMIYQEKFGDLKKAKEMFDSCKAESPRSEIAQEALTKSANISKVEEYRMQLSEEQSSGQDSSEQDSSGRDSSEQDSSGQDSSEKKTEEPGKALFLLAELYLTQMNQPDSALAEYLVLADKYPESEFAPKALSAAAWILENVKHDTVEAKNIHRRIMKDYPGSDYLKSAVESLGAFVDSLEVDNPERNYFKAEKVLLEYGDVEFALVLYNEIIERFPQSIYAGKAAYAIAWITEYYANPGDSTVALAYQKVIDEYPNSEYADAARIKLGLVSRKKAPPPPSPQEEQSPEEELADTSLADTTGSSGPSIPMAPTPLKPGEFVYPETEIESGIQGRVAFKIMVDFEGTVMDAVLVNKTGNYWIDEAARKAVMATTFEPDSVDMFLGEWLLYNVEVKPPSTEEDTHIDQTGFEH